MRDLLQATKNRASNEMSDHESEDEDSDDQAPDAAQETPLEPSLRDSNATATQGPANTWLIPTLKKTHDAKFSTCGPKDMISTADNDIIERGIITQQMAEEVSKL